MLKTSRFPRYLALSAAFAASLALSSASAKALGSTPVTVVNPADLAKSMNVQHPFVMGGGCQTSTSFCTLSINVPTTERWVVESASFMCDFAQTSNLIKMEVDAVVGNRQGQYFFSPLDHGFVTGDGSQSFAQGSQNLRFYADPGSNVDFVGEISHANFFFCTYTLTGQAIDVP